MYKNVDEILNETMNEHGYGGSKKQLEIEASLKVNELVKSVQAYDDIMLIVVREPFKVVNIKLDRKKMVGTVDLFYKTLPCNTTFDVPKGIKDIVSVQIGSEKKQA